MVFAISGCFLLFRLILYTKKYKNRTIVYSVMVCVVFAFLTLFMVRLRGVGGLGGILNFIRLLTVFIFVMMMNNDEKKNIVSMTTNLYAWIVGISMAGYMFLLMGLNLPYSIIMVPDDLFYPPMQNYGIFILLSSDGRFDNFFRFQSVFTEPGHLGTISAILLYVNRYELKRKSVLVIFISVLLSLSFAAYVLAGLGYLICIIAKSKNFYKTILKIGIVTTLVFVLGLYYYERHPDSIFSIVVLSRFGFGDGITATEALEGRTRGINHFYETQFLTSTRSFLWGANLTESQHFVLFGRGGVNSYRVFLIQNGIIAMILLLLMYFSIVAIAPSKLGFGLLFLCSMSFLQRIQVPLWEMHLFIFVGAVQCYYAPKNLIKAKNEILCKSGLGLTNI